MKTVINHIFKIQPTNNYMPTSQDMSLPKHQINLDNNNNNNNNHSNSKYHTTLFFNYSNYFTLSSSLFFG